MRGSEGERGGVRGSEGSDVVKAKKGREMMDRREKGGEKGY